MSVSEPLLLAIETSCDETAVAILRGKSSLLASEIASQIALHQPYGGVVPEVASRNHLTQMQPVIDAALQKANVQMDEIDAFAATNGPGLATSLMIGASTAKGLAISFRKPYLAVNHLEGHLLSPFFGRAIEPSIALVVSGGHTLLIAIRALGDYQMLGQTRDDAAGEAFDKVAKLLGLPYPGGPEIDKRAKLGDAKRFDLPRSMMHSGDFQFSFSGLKTAVRYLLPKTKPEDLNDLCASFQEAAVDVLVAKTIAAAESRGLKTLAISGGVSCNSRLREQFEYAAKAHGYKLLLANRELCTDNAAMIAHVAAAHFANGESSPIDSDINPNLRLR